MTNYRHARDRRVYTRWSLIVPATLIVLSLPLLVYSITLFVAYVLG